MFAAESGWPVFATQNHLQTRWPAFHDLLVTHTPFRSVVALSLPGPLRGYGALDLYLTHPVGLQLSHAAAWTEWTEVDGPPWTNTDPARQRRGSGWPPAWSAWHWARGRRCAGRAA